MNHQPSFASSIRMALEGLNCEKAALHSQLDHHVEGLNYLNLSRSPKFTLKLYLIEAEVGNNHGVVPGGEGYLVSPHSHRYEFMTQVLAGSVTNVLFKQAKNRSGYETGPFDLFAYNPDSCGFEPQGSRGLVIKSQNTYHMDETYYIRTDEIHTLQTTGIPTLLCLTQFEDLSESSSLFLPRGFGSSPDFKRTGRTPSPDETKAMRDRALEMMGAVGR